MTNTSEIPTRTAEDLALDSSLDSSTLADGECGAPMYDRLVRLARESREAALTDPPSDS